MHPLLYRLVAACLLVPAVPLSAIAAPREDSAVIREGIESFLKRQAAGLPGQASFVIGTVEANPNRPPCSAVDVSMAPGARPYGRTTVLVACRAGANWSLYVPVQIKVVADYLVSAKNIYQGQIVGENDWTTQSGDLGELPTGILTSPEQAVGRIAAVSIPAGRPLRSDLLRKPPAVQSGQSVKVISRGPGFEVANEGRALTNAVDGQVVQVRLDSGQMVSGIARPGGIVEIGF